MRERRPPLTPPASLPSSVSPEPPRASETHSAWPPGAPAEDLCGEGEAPRPEEPSLSAACAHRDGTGAGAVTQEASLALPPRPRCPQPPCGHGATWEGLERGRRPHACGILRAHGRPRANSNQAPLLRWLQEEYPALLRGSRSGHGRGGGGRRGSHRPGPPRPRTLHSTAGPPLRRHED